MVEQRSVELKEKVPGVEPSGKQALRCIAEILESGIENKDIGVTVDRQLLLLRKALYDEKLVPHLGVWLLAWLWEHAKLKRLRDVATEGCLPSTSKQGLRATLTTLSGPSSVLPLANPDLPSEERLARAVLRYITNDHMATKESLKGFLQEGTPVYVLKSFEADESIFKPAMQLLNLARTWLGTLLPHCLSKRNRVEYGLIQVQDRFNWAGEAFSNMSADKREKFDRKDWTKLDPSGESRRLMAVPFVGRDKPSKTAQFASPEVLIGLTALSYRYEGLRQGDIRMLTQDMRSKQMDPNPKEQTFINKNISIYM